MPEIWKPIKGWEGLYEVSSEGNVKSLRSKRLLKPSKTNGYLHVGLYRNGHGKNERVHTLVINNFIGEAPKNMQACHWDGNKENNKITNLRWGTCKENAEDKRRHGRIPLGEHHGISKLKSKDVLEVRRLHKTGTSIRGIARLFKVDPETIKRVLIGKNWSWLKSEPPKLGDPDYNSGHSIDADGYCNMGCC